ncbi:MAG: hypothetical protein AAF348_13105 [Bacteroidota bacterium]
MKKLSIVQKILLTSGIVLTVIGIFARYIGWENNDCLALFYTGTSFMWIAFLNKENKCERRFIKKLFRRQQNG